MRTSFFVLVGVIATGLASWMVSTQGGVLARKQAANEKWVDANHLQVLSRGAWQEVELMPLADHLCHSRQPMFLRYCSDPS